ncbi:hypothetical protein [Usitatibacter palustris]|uniref:Lipoprotein n=1 Tax=Usitatibacter palustris TaxID=2732487 RepID=A0A6M4H269_9PROT|nr:hypothetical protein [Usitatibacter palustris]QJR13576.1 hypothetical protein DSM104440_00360 [Usitatibacter palustris]
MRIVILTVIRFAPVGALLLIGLVAAGCGKKPAAAGPSEMQTVCEGQPLRTVERREQAQQDGYDIDRRFDCITKESWAANQQYRDRAASTRNMESVQPVDIVLVDVNTATQEEIAVVITVSRETAAQIIVERGIRRFKDWPDLTSRIKAFRDPQAAVAASTCGLTVDGKSLEGVPPNGLMAARLRETYRDYNRR